MTIDWKYQTVNPYQKEWEQLSKEDKERFYRHNFMHRPEEVAKKTISDEDPMLKVVRNFIPEGADAREALEKLKEEGEKRAKISKSRGEASKNGQKV